MAGTMKFSTTLKEIPVEIDGKNYILRELDGIGFTKWQEAVGGKAEADGKGNIKITDINIKDPTLTLLQLCLYDDKNMLVPLSVLKTWPQKTVLKSLFELAQDLSGLKTESNKTLDDEAKN